MAEVSQPTAEINRCQRIESIVLGIGGLVVAAAIFVATSQPTGPYVVLADNIHWTAAYLTAAILAGLGWARSRGACRSARFWIFAGLGAYAFGQILWDIQVAAAWNPFPGPSDLFFALSGVGLLVGVIKSVLPVLPKTEASPFLLDLAILATFSVGITLAMSLPSQGTMSGLQFTALLLYPVFQLTVTWAAILASLYARVPNQVGRVLFVLALAINSWLWMEWNLRTLAGTLADGTIYNAMFSLNALLLGMGASRWSVLPESRSQEFGQRLLRYLPLAAVVMAAALIIHGALIDASRLETTVAGVAAGVAIFVLAAWRQSLLVRSLRTSETHLRNVLQTSPDLVYVFDIATQTPTLFNDAVIRRFGYDPRTFPGEHLDPMNLIHPDDREALPEEWKRVSDLPDGTINTHRFRALAADGTYRWLETNEIVFHRSPTGEAETLLGTAEDVTDRVLAEDRSRVMNQELERKVQDRTRELSHANQELQAFASAVAHDLRSPVRAIDGYAAILADDLKEVAGGENQQMLKRIRDVTKRMAGIIDRMLSLAQLKVAPLERQEMNLAVLAYDVADTLDASDPTRQVRWEIDAEIPVYADPTLIRVVLDNLMSNAFKFSRQSGEAKIEVKAIVDAATGETGFFVRDNGLGFPREQAQRLFEPFYRLHSESEYEGSGIGLATVQRIVQRHGGDVAAAANEGEGAIFTVQLPMPTTTIPERQTTTSGR